MPINLASTCKELSVALPINFGEEKTNEDLDIESEPGTIPPENLAIKYI